MPGMLLLRFLRTTIISALLVCLLSLPAGSSCPRERFVSFEIQNFTDQEVDGLELAMWGVSCGDLVDLWPSSSPAYYDSVACWLDDLSFHFKWYFPPIAPGEWKTFRWMQPDAGDYDDPQIWAAAWTSGPGAVAAIPFPDLGWWPSLGVLGVWVDASWGVPPEGVYVKRWLGLPELLIPLDSLQADNHMVSGTSWDVVDEHEHLLLDDDSVWDVLTPTDEPACLAMYTLRMVGGTSPYMVVLGQAALEGQGPSTVECSTWGRIKSMYR
jgi:hypothetical protein